MAAWTHLVFVLAFAGRGWTANAVREEPRADSVHPAIVSDFRNEDPKASNVAVFYRGRITADGEVLVVTGTARREFYRPQAGRVYLQSEDLIGIYLTKRGTSKPYRLLLEKAGHDVELQVAHCGPSELVLRRYEGMGRPLKSLQLSIDSKTPRLLERFEYEPFRVTRIIDRGGVPYFVASDMKQTLIVRPAGEGLAIETGAEAKAILDSLDYYEWSTPQESFRYVMPEWRQVRRFGPARTFLLEEDSEGKCSRILEVTPGGTRSYPLPQSGWAEFEKSRPRRLRDGYRKDDTRIQEEIGPGQVVGNRLWFGKSFYDAEGVSGVGGFGYFDWDIRCYVIYSPPEVRDWSVSAILVAGRDVWMATATRGEYGNSPGRLLRWDMEAKMLRWWPLGAVVNAMTRYRGSLYLAADDGIAVLTEQELRHYLIAMSPDRKYRFYRRTA